MYLSNKVFYISKSNQILDCNYTTKRNLSKSNQIWIVIRLHREIFLNWTKFWLFFFSLNFYACLRDYLLENLVLLFMDTAFFTKKTKIQKPFSKKIQKPFPHNKKNNSRFPPPEMSCHSGVLREYLPSIMLRIITICLRCQKGGHPTSLGHYYSKIFF